jgi:tripartite-type tricarboxylate transporter receptor subunit TctC
MKFPRRQFLHLAAGAAAMPALPRVARAQAYPTRPVTMVVPFAAGGAVDTYGRIVASRLSEIFRQQVIVENVSGAGGMTGSARVAKAAPDGYQFLLGHSGTHSYNQTLYKKPLYDAVKDFEPVAIIVGTTKILVTRRDFPASTLPEFIAYAKANQAKLQYASAGAGSETHISCVLLHSVVGLDVTHVPYRSAGQAMQDLIAGRVDYMCNSTAISVAQIEAGALKPIAMLSPNRNPALPKIATAGEQGLKDFDADSWGAFFLPKGTPVTIVQRLANATSDALDTPAVARSYLELGVSVPPPERRTPEFLTKFLPTEIAKWAGPIRASGVSMD